MFGRIAQSQAFKMVMIGKRETRLDLISRITGENVYHGIMKNSTGESSYAAWDMLPSDYQKVYLGIADNLRERIEKELA